MIPQAIRSAAGSVPPARQRQFFHRSKPQAGVLGDTVILTQNGETQARDIQIGDQVITRTAGLVPVAHVLHHHTRLHCVTVAAGSLGDTRPDCDVLLPAVQEVLIRDWRAQALFGQPQAVVPVSMLVDGEFIRDEGQMTLDLIELQFERPYVIYAGGLELAGGLVRGDGLRRAA